MKQKNRFARSLLLCLLSLLIALCAIGCHGEQPPENTPEPPAQNEGNEVPRTGAWANATYVKDTVLGDGAKTVAVKVVADGQSITLTIKTDRSTLREAMDEHGLLTGEDGPYGLYIESVNGIVVKIEDGGYWWGITKAGAATPTGVDGITIADGEQYELTKTNTY